jgi:hypothetical protein
MRASRRSTLTVAGLAVGAVATGFLAFGAGHSIRGAAVPSRLVPGGLVCQSGSRSGGVVDDFAGARSDETPEVIAERYFRAVRVPGTDPGQPAPTWMVVYGRSGREAASEAKVYTARRFPSRC